MSGQHRLDRANDLVIELPGRDQVFVRRTLLQQFAKALDLVAQLRSGYWQGELPLLVAKADQELEPVGQCNRVEHSGSGSDGLNRAPLRGETGDAVTAEIILELADLEQLYRIPRFPDQPCRSRRIRRCPAQQQVAEFEIDRAEGSSVRGAAVAIFDRNVLANRFQSGDGTAIAGERQIRLAALARQTRPLPIPAERELWRRRLLSREGRPVGQARRFVQPMVAIVEVREANLRQ